MKNFTDKSIKSTHQVKIKKTFYHVKSNRPPCVRFSRSIQWGKTIKASLDYWTNTDTLVMAIRKCCWPFFLMIISILQQQISSGRLISILGFVTVFIHSLRLVWILNVCRQQQPFQVDLVSIFVNQWNTYPRLKTCSNILFEGNY